MNGDDQTSGSHTDPPETSSTGLSALDFGETKTLEQYAMLAERFRVLRRHPGRRLRRRRVVDRLVATSVELLDVTAAGLLLLDGAGKLQPIASSSEDARMLELFQLQNEEGPCLESVSTGQVVSVPDLDEAIERWPRFSRAALERGFHSVHAVPLRLRDEHIGGLNLFSARQPPISQASRRVIQALADVATIGILQQRSLNTTSLLAEQLQTALNSRVSIEQAKGVLAESGQVDMDRAFEALRSYARSSNQRLSDVAQQVVSRSLDPESVLRGWHWAAQAVGAVLLVPAPHGCGLRKRVFGLLLLELGVAEDTLLVSPPAAPAGELRRPCHWAAVVAAAGRPAVGRPAAARRLAPALAAATGRLAGERPGSTLRWRSRRSPRCGRRLEVDPACCSSWTV